MEIVLGARDWADVSASTFLPTAYGGGYLAGPAEVRLCDRLTCVVFVPVDSASGRLPGTVRFGLQPVAGSALAERLAAAERPLVDIAAPPEHDLDQPSDSLPMVYFLTEARVRVPQDAIPGLEGHFRSAGADVVREGQGIVVVLSSQRLRITPAWGEAGVDQLSFTLRRELPGNPTFRFGPLARLRFGPGRTATWSF